MTSTRAPLTSADETADEYDVTHHGRRPRAPRPPHREDQVLTHAMQVDALLWQLDRLCRLAEPADQPQRAGAAGRPAHYPTWVYVLIQSMIRTAGTQRAAVAEVAAMWPQVLNAARACAATAGDGLPARGPKRHHWRYWLEHTLSDVIDDQLEAFTRDAIAQAHSHGMLAPTHTHAVNDASRPNTVGGDVKFYDSPSDRASDDIDEDTGEVLRRRRVDPASRVGQRGGQKESCWGSPFQTLSVRQAGWRTRVILDVASVQKGVGEAQMFVERIARLTDLGADIQAILYDGALRGTHISQIAEAGLLAISPVIAHRSEGGGSKARRGRTEKRRLLKLHDGPDGSCRHQIYGIAGRAHEVTVNDRGQTNEVALASRNERRPRAGRWVWYVVVRVECPNGEKTVDGQACHEIRLPLSQQPEDTANGFQRCEYLRQIPPSTRAYDEFYAFRNDTETLHSQTKNRSWLGGRVPAYGRRRQLAMLIGFALAENCITAWVAAGRPLVPTKPR